MTKLKGMTWNHERGVAPLIKASETFEAKTGIKIEWDARSLSDFEIFPLEELAEKYDFIMIDHPHIGIAHEKNLLVPLEAHLDASVLEDHKQGTVGQSYMSYHWENHQYAIPLDAAAQVGAYRADLIEGKVPTTWSEVNELAKSLKDGKKIAIPFVPVHAYSSFFTVCSQLSEKLFWSEGSDLDKEVGAAALEILENIVAVADKESINMDPINMLDRMGKDDDIVYSPLVYGYSNYAREGYLKNIVKFCDMPMSKDEPSGSMIGGVGLAISTKCKYVDAALKFMNMVITPEYQKTEFFNAGGQPGHIEAWKDEAVNEGSNGFFIETLRTLECGSMRPRFSGYIDFQFEAGTRIREAVSKGISDKKEFVGELNALIRTCRENGGLK